MRALFLKLIQLIGPVALPVLLQFITDLLTKLGGARVETAEPDANTDAAIAAVEKALPGNTAAADQARDICAQLPD